MRLRTLREEITYNPRVATEEGWIVELRTDGRARLTWHTLWARSYVGHVFTTPIPPEIAAALENDQPNLRDLICAWLEPITGDLRPSSYPRGWCYPVDWHLVRLGKRIM